MLRAGVWIKILFISYFARIADLALCSAAIQKTLGNGTAIGGTCASFPAPQYYGECALIDFEGIAVTLGRRSIFPLA